MRYHKLGPRPKKPWRNIEDCKRLNAPFLLGTNLDGIWPCYRCGGRGKVYSPDAICDPIEGYSSADLITCTHCNGSGEVTKKDFKTNVYRRELEEWRNTLAEWKRNKRVCIQAIHKLTRHERILLGI